MKANNREIEENCTKGKGVVEKTMSTNTGQW